MIRKLVIGYLMTLVACSTISVPSHPIDQTQDINKQMYIGENKKQIIVDKGDVIAIHELTSVHGVITAKARHAYKNSYGDVVFKKNAILKFNCAKQNTLIEINGSKCIIPVILENKDHVETGCIKHNGRIRFIKFIK